MNPLDSKEFKQYTNRGKLSEAVKSVKGEKVGSEAWFKAVKEAYLKRGGLIANDPATIIGRTEVEKMKWQEFQKEREKQEAKPKAKRKVAKKKATKKK